MIVSTLCVVTNVVPAQTETRDSWAPRPFLEHAAVQISANQASALVDLNYAQSQTSDGWSPTDLLNRLETLGLHGDLADPHQVGAALGLTFTKPVVGQPTDKPTQVTLGWTPASLNRMRNAQLSYSVHYKQESDQLFDVVDSVNLDFFFNLQAICIPLSQITGEMGLRHQPAIPPDMLSEDAILLRSRAVSIHSGS